MKKIVAGLLLVGLLASGAVVESQHQSEYIPPNLSPILAATYSLNQYIPPNI